MPQQEVDDHRHIPLLSLLVDILVVFEEKCDFIFDVHYVIDFILLLQYYCLSCIDTSLLLSMIRKLVQEIRINDDGIKEIAFALLMSVMISFESILFSACDDRLFSEEFFTIILSGGIKRRIFITSSEETTCLSELSVIAFLSLD